MRLNQELVHALGKSYNAVLTVMTRLSPLLLLLPTHRHSLLHPSQTPNRLRPLHVSLPLRCGSVSLSRLFLRVLKRVVVALSGAPLLQDVSHECLLFCLRIGRLRPEINQSGTLACTFILQGLGEEYCLELTVGRLVLVKGGRNVNVRLVRRFL